MSNHFCLFILLFNLQISMSVNWRYIHAVLMPTVLTQMAASTAHVRKASKEMGSTVQVNFTFVHKLYMHMIDNKFYLLLQIFQSVKEGWMAVTQMQLAQTQLEVMSAIATLGSLEMDIHVLVSKRSYSSAPQTTRL